MQGQVNTNNMHVRSIENNFSLIIMKSNGIIHVDFKAEYEIGTSEMEELFNMVSLFTQNKNAKLVFYSEDGIFNITEAGRISLSRLCKAHKHSGLAIVINSLSQRILSNLIKKEIAPFIQLGTFASIQDAESWLNQIPERSNTDD